MTLRQRLKELVNQKPRLYQREIAEILNKEGYRTKLNSEWNQEHVSKYCLKWKLARRNKRRKTRSNKSSSVDVKTKVLKPKKHDYSERISMIELLMSSKSFSDQQKINMVKVLSGD